MQSYNGGNNGDIGQTHGEVDWTKINVQVIRLSEKLMVDSTMFGYQHRD
jgi:hypothetical protein